MITCGAFILFYLLGLRHIGRCCNMHPPHIKSNTSFRYTRLMRCTIQQIVSSSYILGEILHISELSRNRLMSSSIPCQHKQAPSFQTRNGASFSSLPSITNLCQFWSLELPIGPYSRLHNMNQEWTYTFLADRATLIHWAKLPSYQRNESTRGKLLTTGRATHLRVREQYSYSRYASRNMVILLFLLDTQNIHILYLSLDLPVIWQGPHRY